MNFTKLNLNSYSKLAPFFKGLNYVLAEYSFGYLFMYNEYVEYEYAIEEDVLFMRFKKDDIYIWLAPICKDEKDFISAVSKIKEVDSLAQEKTIIRSVPERFISNIEKKFDAMVDKKEKWADYVYEIEPFSLIKGKKYHAKRNYISRFIREYGIAEINQINQDNIDGVLEFFEKFKQNEDKDSSIFDMELKATSLILKNLSVIKAEAYVMSLAGEIIGFTIGEISGNTLIVHVEKCNKQYVGVYETLTNAFVRKMREKYPSLVYVNREDDAGDEGLKKAKLSYHPIAVMPKCEVTIL